MARLYTSLTGKVTSPTGDNILWVMGTTVQVQNVGPKSRHMDVLTDRFAAKPGWKYQMRGMGTDRQGGGEMSDVMVRIIVRFFTGSGQLISEHETQGINQYPEGGWGTLVGDLHTAPPGTASVAVLVKLEKTGSNGGWETHLPAQYTEVAIDLHEYDPAAAPGQLITPFQSTFDLHPGHNDGFYGKEALWPYYIELDQGETYSELFFAPGRNSQYSLGHRLKPAGKAIERNNNPTWWGSYIRYESMGSLRVFPGETLRLAGWVRILNGSGTCRLLLRIFSPSNSLLESVPSSEVQVGSTWQRLEAFVEVPANGKTAAYILACDPVDGLDAELHWDDITFETLDPTPRYPVYGPGGGFPGPSRFWIDNTQTNPTQYGVLFAPDMYMSCDASDWFVEMPTGYPMSGRGLNVGHHDWTAWSHADGVARGLTWEHETIRTMGDPGTLKWEEPEHGQLEWGTWNGREFNANLKPIFYPDPNFEGVLTIPCSAQERGTGQEVRWNLIIHQSKRPETPVGPQIYFGSTAGVKRLEYKVGSPWPVVSSAAGNTLAYGSDWYVSGAGGIDVRDNRCYFTTLYAGSTESVALVYLIENIDRSSWKYSHARTDSDRPTYPRHPLFTRGDFHDLRRSFGDPVVEWGDDNSYLTAVKISPDGRWIYMADLDGYIARAPLGTDGWPTGPLEHVAGKIRANRRIDYPEDVDPDGVGLDALMVPMDFCFGPEGEIYVANQEYAVIQRLDPVTKEVTTIAGSTTSSWDLSYRIRHRDGEAADSLWGGPSAVFYHEASNFLYVLDGYGSALRRINLETMMVETVVVSLGIEDADSRHFDPRIEIPTDRYLEDLGRYSREIDLSDPAEDPPYDGYYEHWAPAVDHPIRNWDDSWLAGLVVDDFQNAWISSGMHLARIDLQTGVVHELSGRGNWWGDWNGYSYGSLNGEISKLCLINHGADGFDPNTDGGGGGATGPRSGAVSTQSTDVRAYTDVEVITGGEAIAHANPRPSTSRRGANRYWAERYGPWWSRHLEDGFDQHYFKYLQDMCFDNEGNLYVLLYGGHNVGMFWSGCLKIDPEGNETVLFDTFDPTWRYPGGAKGTARQPASANPWPDQPNGFGWDYKGKAGVALWRTSPRLLELEEQSFSPTGGPMVGSYLFEPYALCWGGDDRLYVYSTASMTESVWVLDHVNGTLEECVYFGGIDLYGGIGGSQVPDYYARGFGVSKDGRIMRFRTRQTAQSGGGDYVYAHQIYELIKPGKRAHWQTGEEYPVEEGKTPLDYDDVINTVAPNTRAIFGSMVYSSIRLKSADLPGEQGTFSGVYGMQFNPADDRMYWSEYGYLVRSVGFDGIPRSDYDAIDTSFSEAVVEGPYGFASFGYIHNMGAHGDSLFLVSDLYHDSDVVARIDMKEPGKPAYWIAGAGHQAPVKRKGPARKVGTVAGIDGAVAGPNGEFAFYGPGVRSYGIDHFLIVVRPGEAPNYDPATDDYPFPWPPVE